MAKKRGTRGSGRTVKEVTTPVPPHQSNLAKHLPVVHQAGRAVPSGDAVSPSRAQRPGRSFSPLQVAGPGHTSSGPIPTAVSKMSRGKKVALGFMGASVITAGAASTYFYKKHKARKAS